MSADYGKLARETDWGHDKNTADHEGDEYCNVDFCVLKIAKALERAGLEGEVRGFDGEYTTDQRAALRKRLKELGK